MITTVLLADNAPSGRIHCSAQGLDKAATLIVCDPASIAGFVPTGAVRVIDRTVHMPLRRYKEIQRQLSVSQSKAGRGWNEAATGEWASELTAVVEDRLQDALHSGEVSALLAAAVLDKLAEQVNDARNCRFVPDDLTALSERVLADLPEHIRNYRRDTTKV